MFACMCLIYHSYTVIDVKQLHGNSLFCHLDCWICFFGTALVGFTAFTYVLVMSIFLVDRSFCACGRVLELFEKYMKALKTFLC